MLKVLVGAASVAIIAFVGFYFYQAYWADTSARQHDRQASIAAAKAIIGEQCVALYQDLSRGVAPPDVLHGDDRKKVDFFWGCVAGGHLLPADLLRVPVAFLLAEGGPPRVPTNAGCVQLVGSLARMAPAGDALDRAREESQVRGCLSDSLLVPLEVHALAGAALDDLLRAEGLA